MKKKHVPERTCVGCRSVKPKRELIRIVRDPEGHVDVDFTGKKSGRGVYICPNVPCLEAALKGGRISAGLETDLPPEVVSRLREKLHHV
ncbi:MAG: YlxR family protein [Firmicutes bacterium]|nr:YlxR family protein [Dethiobacter sp.]MBS3888686.1 YlxR family protein [Bacillota bacterium]MBS4053290.1 YlxR family protein [Thermaerobacter sp.]